jgi:pyruvate,water dikinase
LRERENLRFERTRVFGHVRRVFLELGRRLYALDALEDPRDIFYLELKEILALREGTSTLINIKALVALRKAEFASYADQEVPANRFETRGLVYQGHRFQGTGQATGQAKGETESDVRQGIACCPGLVKGRVCVVQNPREANMQVGDILVARQTDPGWIMLFPAASGLLVERGSLLSHSAIVAREMSLPAVVSVTDLCQWLKTGDWVEFDGSTGIIKKLSGVSSHE